MVAYVFVRHYSILHLILIISATILIALAGYLFNDIADIDLDTVNKKEKQITKLNKIA